MIDSGYTYYCTPRGIRICSIEQDWGTHQSTEWVPVCRSSTVSILNLKIDKLNPHHQFSHPQPQSEGTELRSVIVIDTQEFVQKERGSESKG